MATTKTQQVLALARHYGVLRPRDLAAHGIPREYLVRLHRQGVFDRPAPFVTVEMATPAERENAAQFSDEGWSGQVGWVLPQQPQRG